MCNAQLSNHFARATVVNVTTGHATDIAIIVFLVVAPIVGSVPQSCCAVVGAQYEADCRGACAL